jgi:hypothetical protein
LSATAGSSAGACFCLLRLSALRALVRSSIGALDGKPPQEQSTLVIEVTNKKEKRRVVMVSCANALADRSWF